MKFSDDMRFPHPVLAPETGDFGTEEFEVGFVISEILDTGQVTLAHEISLTQADLAELIMGGKARAGIFVRCQDTYFSDLREIGWPNGKVEFGAGKLLNRVTIRPIVWLSTSIQDWTPANVHPEFDLPLALARGDIIAIGGETVIHVGKAKLAPLESIFALQRSDEVPTGQLKVDLEPNKITIIAHSETFNVIEELRSNPKGRAVTLNSVYLPVVMEVLDSLRGGIAAHEHKRWAQPFLARCVAKGVVLENPELLADAQALLELPATALRTLILEPAP